MTAHVMDVVFKCVMVQQWHHSDCITSHAAHRCAHITVSRIPASCVSPLDSLPYNGIVHACLHSHSCHMPHTHSYDYQHRSSRVRYIRRRYVTDVRVHRHGHGHGHVMGCVKMCTHMCMCMCVPMNEHVHADVDVWANLMYVHKRVYVLHVYVLHVYVLHVYVHVHAYVHVYVSMCMRMYVCMYVRMYICMHVYVMLDLTGSRSIHRLLSIRWSQRWHTPRLTRHHLPLVLRDRTHIHIGTVG